MSKIIILVTAVLLTGALVIGSLFVGLYGISVRGGDLAKGLGISSGTAANCAIDPNVPTEDMPWVVDASSKYLNGDQAALISLIQIESGWKSDASNKNSSARGLGQFLTSTAKGFVEFTGGDDKHGTVWPAGKLYDDVNTDDARFDAKRSVYAAAHLFGPDVAKYNGDVYQAYYKNYHGFSTPEQEQESKAGAQRLLDYYNKLKNQSNCQGGGVAKTFTCGQYSYVFPVQDSGAGYGRTHHNYSATDIFDIQNGQKVEGATLVAVTSGTIKHAGTDGGKGGWRVTLVGDDGFYYYYAHMQASSITVQVGQKVTAGQMVGKLGETGDAQGTFPHVHFGISDGQQIAGFYPDKVSTDHSGDATSGYRVLDAWKAGKCVDPRS